jgi:V/A-type H+-transporting ATPase subunit I
MKSMLVCGARDMRGRTLELLLDLAAVELHRRAPVVGGRAARESLLRLFSRVHDYLAQDVPIIALEEIPDDLVALTGRLLEERDSLDRRRRQLGDGILRQRVWGHCSPRLLSELAEGGVYIQVWETDDTTNLDTLRRQGALVWEDTVARKGQRYFCTLARNEPLVLDWAANLPPPEEDPDLLNDELQAVRAQIESLDGVLCWIAHERLGPLGEQIAAQVDALSIDAGRVQTHTDEHVFVLSGWIPVDNVAQALQRLSELPGVTASARDPEPGEEPPTLTSYPRWVRPIQSIFEFMGYRPGYYEYDAGHLIIVFFTLFSALLINDGGYGLLMLVLLTVFYRRIGRAIGSGAVQLGLYVAAATTVYGALTGAFFGLQFEAVFGVRFLAPDTNDMIRLSFGLGILHLSIGRLLQIFRCGWSYTSLAESGWLALLWSVYLAVINVFTGGEIPAVCGPMMASGALLVVLFARTELGPGRAQLAGLGLLLGNATSLFSDIMSYIRIMAVGFASMSLAMTANLMAEQTGSLLAGAVILLLGHGINLGLGVIALFVHGLRLNTLEFARQLGVTWSGRAFEPMAHFDLKALEERHA